MAVWTGKSLRMERPLQVLIAFLLTEKLVDGKSDHPNTWGTISWNTPFWPLQKHVDEIVQLRANMSQSLFRHRCPSAFQSARLAAWAEALCSILSYRTVLHSSE